MQNGLKVQPHRSEGLLPPWFWESSTHYYPRLYFPVPFLLIVSGESGKLTSLGFLNSNCNLLAALSTTMNRLLANQLQRGSRTSSTTRMISISIKKKRVPIKNY